MPSESEANEGRSTFLIEILYRNFQSRDIACCFILSGFSIMKLPLDFQKFFVKNIQKIKNGLRPSSPRFARSFPPGGSHEMRRLNYWYQKTSYTPLFENFLKGKFSNKKEKHAFLHHRLSVGASPGGGKKSQEMRL